MIRIIGLIVIVIFINMILSGCLNHNINNSQENNNFTFEVIYVDPTKPALDGKPLIKYNSQKGLEAYSIQQIESKEYGIEYIPIIDSKGRSVSLKTVDDVYNLFMHMWNIHNVKLVYKAMPEVFSLGMMFPSDNPQEILTTSVIMQVGGDIINVKNSLKIGNIKTEYGKGYVYYIDDNYQYQSWEPLGDNFILKQQLTFNPDTVGYNKVPDLDAVSQFKGDLNKEFLCNPNGFIWMKINDTTAQIKGEEVTMPQPLEIIDNTVMAPIDWVVEKLGGNTHKIDNNNINYVFRKYGIIDYFNYTPRLRGTEQQANILFVSGESSAIHNGETVRLPMAPYKKNDHMMASLENICSMLGARYCFRSIDNTVLVSLFPR